MLNFKKLALIANEIWSKRSAETASEPKTMPPTVFQKRSGGKKSTVICNIIGMKQHRNFQVPPTISKV